MLNIYLLKLDIRKNWSSGSNPFVNYKPSLHDLASPAEIQWFGIVMLTSLPKFAIHFFVWDLFQFMI